MTTHPLLAAAIELSPAILAAGDSIEENQKVPDEIVEQLADAGFFQVAVPREFGGEEPDLRTVWDALEIIANADASTAWITLIICANPWLFGNSMHESFWKDTYGKHPRFRSAGHIGPNGRALEVEGGYRVSGLWKYGSGYEHCDYMLSGCMIFDSLSL